MLLLTLTTPHARGDDLAALVAQQAQALQAFFRQRAVKSILAEMGELGRVRAFEVTHGRKGHDNGWHPHYHFLQFTKAGADAAQLMDWKTRLYLEWAKACQRAGLGVPSFKHGIDLRDGSYAQQYVSKWGLDHEMTKGHIKKAKAGGKPFRSAAGSPGGSKRPASGGPVFRVRPGVQRQAAAFLVAWAAGHV